MNITKVKNFFFKYVQTILLLLGLVMIVIATWGLFNFYIALMLAGIFMILLAFLINYERRFKE